MGTFERSSKVPYLIFFQCLYKIYSSVLTLVRLVVPYILHSSFMSFSDIVIALSCSPCYVNFRLLDFSTTLSWGGVGVTQYAHARLLTIPNLSSKYTITMKH